MPTHHILCPARSVLAMLVALSLAACQEDSPQLLGEDVGADASDAGASDVGDAGNNVVFGGDVGTPDLGECEEGAPDPPDRAFFDANCDGIDGDEATSVFVASYGDDLNPGTMALPKLTIAAAIATAVDEDKTWVLVGDGLYEGGFTLAAGVGIAGGYGFGWKRGPSFKTTIRGGNPAITGIDIEEPTTLIGFEVEPTRMPDAGATVLTVYLRGSSGVALDDLTITGGVAGDGADGADGDDGEAGSDGGRGGNGVEDSGSIGCDENSRPNAGTAGAGGCDEGNGGAGGLPAKGGSSGDPGEASAAGTPGGAGGGGSSPGANGEDGPRGMNGTPGAGGDETGEFDGTRWVGSAGVAGADGEAGHGGGGGGGGGGGSSFCDSYGGAGGGGGGGGCGGTGGGGGGAGGASVAIFLDDSDIAISNCVVLGGVGGRGGSGGDGGIGGRGGIGADGGAREDDSGVGGRGGSGGVGGVGGQGGAGSGGPAYGIYSTAALSAMPVATQVTEGTGGQGGIAAAAVSQAVAGDAAAIKIEGQ